MTENDEYVVITLSMLKKHREIFDNKSISPTKYLRKKIEQDLKKGNLK